jgi:deoxyribodipyrimidine photolyase-like uncharacterized protein
VKFHPKARPRHLVIVLGDQLDKDLSGFDGFDAEQDAVWMAEVTEGSAKVWSHKRLARNQRMAMQLNNLSRLDTDSRRDIIEDAGRIRHQCLSQ